MALYRIPSAMLSSAVLGVVAMAIVAKRGMIAPRAGPTYRDHAPYVRDGDTLVVNGMPVRLRGIDAPDDVTPSLATAARERGLWRDRFDAMRALTVLRARLPLRCRTI